MENEQIIEYLEERIKTLNIYYNSGRKPSAILINDMFDFGAYAKIIVERSGEGVDLFEEFQKKLTTVMH